MPLIRLLTFLLAISAPLSAQPRRIVSTAPSITETLFAVGAGDRVVGVTTFCHYPPAALKITKIGTYLEPQIETILSLKPDLVITEDSPLHQDRFTALGLRTLRVRFEKIEDVYESMRKIGDAVGTRAKADALVASIQAGLEDVRRRVAGRPPVSIMFLVGRTPNALDSMVAVGRAAYMNQIIDIAGGRNAFGDSVMRYFRVSTEQIVARDPQVIVDMGDMADTKSVTEAHKRLVAQLWREKMPGLQAVRNGRVYPVASDIFVVTGPRVVECARAFARMLHPEVFH